MRKKIWWNDVTTCRREVWLGLSLWPKLSRSTTSKSACERLELSWPISCQNEPKWKLKEALAKYWASKLAVELQARETTQTGQHWCYCHGLHSFLGALGQELPQHTNVIFTIIKDFNWQAFAVFNGCMGRKKQVLVWFIVRNFPVWFIVIVRANNAIKKCPMMWYFWSWQSCCNPCEAVGLLY